ncbi:hypothetical protein V9L05_15135 [Bernardetia sp. Wsw4-3y2]|uniref:hypothetical protein n=1 Tax=Bernardetia sp. Wsw4-3y2 TaxID=3127471 RepID=UPI0030D3DFE0
MDTKKDTSVVKNEILQASVTTSSATDLQAETEDEIKQRNFLVNLSIYEKARKVIRKNGLDYNVLLESFLKLICKDEGYDYALLQGRLSITTNNQNYVQRQKNHHQSEDSGS